jgi:hypothetical protein
MQSKAILKENLQYLHEKLSTGITILHERYHTNKEEYQSAIKKLSLLNTALVLPSNLILWSINKFATNPISEIEKTLISEHNGIIQYSAKKLHTRLQEVEKIKNEDEKDKHFQKVINSLGYIYTELGKYEIITEDEFKKLVETKDLEAFAQQKTELQEKEVQKELEASQQLAQDNNNVVEQNLEHVNQQNADNILTQDVLLQAIADAYMKNPASLENFIQSLKAHTNSNIMQLFGSVDEERSKQLFDAIKAQNCPDIDSLVAKIKEQDSTIMKIIKEIINGLYSIVTLGNSQTRYAQQKQIKSFVEQLEQQQVAAIQQL